jgi:hypothetical protein
MLACSALDAVFSRPRPRGQPCTTTPSCHPSAYAHSHACFRSLPLYPCISPAYLSRCTHPLLRRIIPSVSSPRALCSCFYSRLTALYVNSAVPSPSIHSITIVVLSTRARAVLRAFTYGRAASTPRRPARPPTAPNSIHFTHRLCFTASQNYGHARRVSCAHVHAREAHPREVDRGGRSLFALTLPSAWSNPPLPARHPTRLDSDGCSVE